MSLASLIPTLLKVSIALNVFCLGLVTTASDATYLARNPRLLLRSLLSMNVVVPFCAASLALALHLQPAVEIGLLALAISPVPPKMPKQAARATGDASYGVALLLTMSILSIAWVPLGVEMLGKVFGISIHMGPSPILMLVLATILGPLLLGMFGARCKSIFGAKVISAILLGANLLLVVASAAVLFSAWRAIASLLATDTVGAILGFIIVGLVAGHLLGGPNDRNRAILAISSAFRHPGIAIAVAAATFPAQKLASAAIILYLILGAVVSEGYLRWMRGRVRSIEGSAALY